MASALVGANFSAPFELSDAVSFFRSTPRWPSASHEFALTYDYITPVALTALIPIFVVILLVALFIFLLIIRYTCCEQAVDARILRMHRSPTATYFQIGTSVFVTFVVFLFIGLGIVFVTEVNFSARDGLDIITGLVVDVSRTGFAFVDVGILIEERLKSFSPADDISSSNVLSGTLGGQFVPAFEAVQRYVLGSYPDLEPLRDSLETAVDDIGHVLDVVRKAISLASGVLVAICLLLLLAPVMIFFLDAMPLNKRSRPWRVFVHVLVIIFPALLAWAMVGITAAVGATVSDVCVTLHDYRDVLFGKINAEDIPANALVKGGITCPDTVDPKRLTEQFNGTIESVLQSDLAVSSIDVLLQIRALSIAETARWSRDEVIRYVDCSALINISGQLEVIACSAEGKSAVQGVFDLFVSFLGLSLILSVALLLSLLGMRVAWSLLVWPRKDVESDKSLDNLSSERYEMSVESEECFTKA